MFVFCFSNIPEAGEGRWIVHWKNEKRISRYLSEFIDLKDLSVFYVIENYLDAIIQKKALLPELHEVLKTIFMKYD